MTPVSSHHINEEAEARAVSLSISYTSYTNIYELPTHNNVDILVCCTFTVNPSQLIFSLKQQSELTSAFVLFFS